MWTHRNRQRVPDIVVSNSDTAGEGDDNEEEEANTDRFLCQIVIGENQIVLQ